MATHSSILAWRVPWIEEPGRLHGVPKSQTQLSDFNIQRDGMGGGWMGGSGGRGHTYTYG